jgi:peptidoglycan/LPS O-acetylase OafA/YrhL
MAASSGGTNLNQRMAYVDGLRAVAVLSVVAFHAAHWDPNLHGGFVQYAFSEGSHGVDLFFVLSGFCLSYPVLRALHRQKTAIFDLAGYFARRTVRIVPPYYLAIAVIVALLLVLGRIGWQMPYELSLERVGWLDFAKQILFADREPQFLNPSFWTLAVEWRWYFLFPIVLWLWTRSRRAFFFVIVCCFIGAATTRAGGFDLPLLPAFMLGIAAAQYEIDERRFGLITLLLAVLATAVGIALEPLYGPEYFVQLQPAGLLAAFFFVLACGSMPALRAVLGFRPLAWVGVASYSISLVHEPVIGALENNAGVSPLVAALGGIAAGFAFWALLERPFMTNPLKARLVNWLAPRIRKLADFVGVPSSWTLAVSQEPSEVATPAPPAESPKRQDLVHHGQ